MGRKRKTYEPSKSDIENKKKKQKRGKQVDKNHLCSPLKKPKELVEKAREKQQADNIESLEATLRKSHGRFEDDPIELAKGFYWWDVELFNTLRPPLREIRTFANFEYNDYHWDTHFKGVPHFLERVKNAQRHARVYLHYRQKLKRSNVTEII